MTTPTLMPDGKTPLVEAARDFADMAHAGQFRRDGVTPYITHPAKVAALLKEAGEDDTTQAVAWLHDTTEDTVLTGADLFEAGFPPSVVGPVLVLTRLPFKEYEPYLAKVWRDPVARAVKVADMVANLTDAPTPKQVAKYTRGIIFLTRGT